MGLPEMRMILTKIASGEVGPDAIVPELPAFLAETGSLIEKQAADIRVLEQRLEALDREKRAADVVRSAEANNINIAQLTGRTAERYEDKLAAVLSDPVALPVYESQVKHAAAGGSAFVLGDGDGNDHPPAGSARRDYDDIARRVMEIQA